MQELYINSQLKNDLRHRNLQGADITRIYDGSYGGFTSILDQLSVPSVSDLLKLNSGEITYTTVEENGEILNNRFEIDFENGVEIIKESKLNQNII